MGSGQDLTGLNWVFRDRGPRLARQDAQCADIGLGQNLVLHRQCLLTYQNTQVCLDWSQFKSFAAGSAHYDEIGPRRSRAVPGGGTELTWPPEVQGQRSCHALTYKTAKMLDGQRWGVTAYSDDPATATAAANAFGEFRPLSDWQGVRR